MPEALQIVASLFTIWAQSSVLAENKEFDRFKDEPVIEQQETEDEMQRRREEILTAAVERRNLILSQTNLGE